MKVLVITNLFPNAYEAQRATFNYQQISELSKLCELKVIAPISWLQKLKNIIRSKKFDNYQITGSSVTAFYPAYFYTPSLFRCGYGIFYFISIFFKTISVVMKDKPNILFGTWAYPDGFAAILFGKLLGIPVVLKVHGTDIHSVNSNCRKNLTSWTLNQADKIISVSQSLADTMINEFSISSNNIEIIKNGVDKNVFNPIDKSIAKNSLSLNEVNTKIILFIGNLKTEKNPLLLVDAFNKLINQSSFQQKINLHLIGDGPLNKNLCSIISELKLDARVFMHGSVAHKEIPLWLNAADILVLPSNNEGMPNVVLESLACHTPVVATKVGGIPEIIDEGVTGFMIEQLSVVSLSKILSDAIACDWNKESFENNSKIHSWQETAQSIMHVLDKVEAE